MKESTPATSIRRGLVGALPALGVIAAALPAFAHHSPAVFDRSREVTLVGTVTEFRWSMPHSWIHLDVANADEETEAWSVEMDPATLLGRSGWTARTVQPGDRVEVTVYPLRNNEKGGQYISVKLPDGRVMDEP